MILPNFKPAWWLNNPHLQTIWPEFMRKRLDLPLQHERFELSCGDFIDLAWSQTGRDHTVIVLHGLCGSIDSPYVRGMLYALNKYNFNTLGLHFRGCGKEPNRLPQMFHAGQTCDLAEVITHLKDQAPHSRIFVIGFSVGANILLKYLGEQGEAAPISGAVAISTPFLLETTQKCLSQGFAKIYQHYLLTSLKFATIRKFINQHSDKIDLFSVITATNIRDFDELVTAPLHGFESAFDYYLQASAYFYLRKIKARTLIIHAKDDPFLPEWALPHLSDFSETTQLLLTEHGGHVGFVSGQSPRNPIYWLEQVVPNYLLNLISEGYSNTP